MKIEFSDKSHIECVKSENPGKILISIASTDSENRLKKTTNAVELSLEDFKKLISEVV